MTGEDTDVCVVGAGPAGALVATRLAEAGHDVVVLEAGPRFDADDRERRMERAIRPGHDTGSVWEMGGPRDRFTASEAFYPLNSARVKGVGGSTLHWQGMVMRLHETDFRERSVNGHAVDWPIDYRDLRSYYAAAERELGVAGADDNPFAPPREEPYPLPAFEPSYSDSLFAAACESLGIATHSVPNARASEPYRGRSACVGYGTCQPVCPSGAKYDATVHTERARAAGAELRAESPVVDLEHDGRGDRVTAAVYADGDGERQLRAREFVLAAGGVEIPRLLLASTSRSYPEGLANSSGTVGRYFHEHLFAGVGGRLEEPTRQNHVGFNTTESHQFYERDDVGRIKLEFLNYAGPSPVEMALSADRWGDALLADLEAAYGGHAAVGALIDQPPRPDSRIALDRSTTDDNGVPVPDVRWRVGEYERRTIERANEIQRAILEELDADIEWTVGPDDTGPAYHHMGTTRMGTDPEASVVTPACRSHELENLWVASSSVFPTGGAMNPTLTIAALALRVADRLEARL